MVHASQHARHRTHLKIADDNWPIKTGYVAFDDSFGAGMGTGTERRPGMFAVLVLTTSVIFCISGPITTKLTSREKSAPARRPCASTARLMSGTILGRLTSRLFPWAATIWEFSNLVWYCVMTPNTAEIPSTTGQKCTEAKDKANQLMEDTGDDGLRSKLKKAYKRFLDKSGRNVSIPILCCL
jgi:hypothetical protein